MSREWRLYLADLLLGCEKIQRYTFGLDGADLRNRK